MSTYTLTVDDIDLIADAAEAADMTVRDFPCWPGSGYTVAVVGNEDEFQLCLRQLGQLDADVTEGDSPTLAERIGSWRSEGVALSVVWYWPNVQLDDEAREHLRTIEEHQGEW